MANPPKIALFGGSFDPIHLGHLQMAESARQHLQLDEIRFIPCQISPHKLGTQPTPVAQRLEMLRLATDALPWATVDDLEASQPGPSYSWQTAEQMRQKFPDARLFWIMGTDQWQALPLWTHPDRLARCVEFIVISRGTTPEPRDGCILHPLEFDHPASATAIREQIATGESRHPWLPPAVAEWIAQHHLYQA